MIKFLSFLSVYCLLFTVYACCFKLCVSSYVYGNVLVVDDVIQRTECDQALYDESLAHLSLSCHPDPKKVNFCCSLNKGLGKRGSELTRVESYLIDCRLTGCVSIRSQVRPKMFLRFIAVLDTLTIPTYQL